MAHGNSITRGFGASDVATTSYPPVLQGLLEAEQSGLWVVHRRGFDGFDTENLTANFSAEVHPLYSASVGRNVVVIHEGMNDIRHGATDVEAIATMLTYCNQAKSLGWEVWICTGMPQQFTAQVMAYQAAYNAYVREHWADFGSKLIDLAADPILSNPSNPTYFMDGLHPNDAGYVVLADVVKAAAIPPPSE